MSSLTASAISGLSGLSYGSSSVTDHVDLGIIDDIIERAPRSATTFPLVQRAYSEVLLKNGISPVEDTTYFQFLLKLGIIRAATWGERWDLWRANNDPSHTPLHEPSSTAYQSFSADVKSRLPFLASASSDLDEGFAPDVDIDDERSDISRHTDLSVVHMLRPSPRNSMTREKSRSSKTASRSMVGYTPNQSLDYDILTLNPPLRTSTPVYAQEAVISPPLPPYSVSEISEALDDASSIDFDRTDRDCSATPRAGTREVVPDRRERTEKELAEMEMLADSFYHTGLLGRCLDVWAQASQWVQQTTRQIDMVRARILQRQTLLHWQKIAVLAARGRSLSEQRLAANQVQCWKCWRARLERRRLSRWEDDMKRREVEIASAQTERRLRQTFQLWRSKARDIIDDRKAVAFHTQTILRQTLSAWYRQTTLSQNLGNFNDWRAHKLSKQAFEVWRYRTRLRSAERALSTLDRMSTLRQVFDEWETRARQTRQAVDKHNRQLLLEMFDLWRRRVHRQRHMEKAADQLHKLQTLRAAFTEWKYAEQGRRIQSAVDNVILGQKFGRWRESLGVLRDMRRIADNRHAEVTMRLAQRALLRWRERFRQKQTLALHADLLSDQRVLRASFSMWRKEKVKVNANRLKAISFNVFFTQRQAFSVWRSRLEEKQRDARLRQQAAYVKKRRLEELRTAFEAWRNLSTHSPRDNAAVFVVQSFRNQNLMRTTLNVWTEKVIFHKSRELDVIDKRTATLLRNAFTRWRDASARIEDTKSLMQSFVELRDGEALRSIFNAWRSAASARRHRREALDRSLQAKDDRLLVSAFTKWRGRFREQQLVEVEQEVARRHEDALMFRVWDRWQGKSLKWKGVRFENARLKKFVWDAWRAELDWVRRERDVSQPRDRRILEEAFEMWREAYSTRVAKASRTRRFRPSLTAAAAVSDQRNVLARGQPAAHHLSKPAPDFRVSSAARRRRSDSYKSARLSLPPPDEEPPTAPSVISEPAYTRASADSRRWRGGSAEPDDDNAAHQPHSTSRRPRLSQPSEAAVTPSGSSELLRALRGTLNR